MLSIRPNPHYLFLVLTLLASVNVQAVASPDPFDVRYHVYRGDIHVANTQFSLQKQNSEWVWHMQTAPRGIYSWLTKKKPFAETRMLEKDNELQLLLENTGDYPQKLPKQSSWFDHINKTIYSMKARKIKRINLPENVYNYHSIHLVYSMMLKANKLKMDVNFYKRGKLLKSSLTLEKQLELPGKPAKKIVDKITQKFDESDKQMIYYYHGDTFAPLKIEQIKPGQDKSVMWRIDSQ